MASTIKIVLLTSSLHFLTILLPSSLGFVLHSSRLNHLTLTSLMALLQQILDFLLSIYLKVMF